MAQDIKQDLLFYGGLNSDDMFEIIPQGDYPLAVNVTNDSKQDDNITGKIVPRKGNEVVVNPFYTNFEGLLPLFERKTCGSVRDETANKIYFFVYEVYAIEGEGVEKFWSIYEYNCYNKTIENQVCRLQFAFFDQEKTVKFGNILYGNLFWVQDGIEPKSLNIEKAINYTKNLLLTVGVDTLLSPTYSVLTMREFNVIKRPPITPLTVRYATDSSIITNNIRGKLFQFRYRYIYRDDTESVWSAISTVPLPNGDVTTNGYFNDSALLNIIQVGYTVDTREVKEVQIAKREYSSALKEPTIFEVVFKDYIQEPTLVALGEIVSERIYSFYNQIAGLALSTREESAIYDVVPLSASSMEVISNPDKVVYGGDIIEPSSRANIVPKVSIEVIRTQVDSETGEIEPDYNSPFDETNIRMSLHPYHIAGGLYINSFYYNCKSVCTAIYISSDLVGASALTIKLRFTENDNTITAKQFNVDISAAATRSEVRDAIVQKINIEMAATRAYSSRSYFEDFITPPSGGFHDEVPDNKWRYLDWAFRTQDTLHPFQGYKLDSVDDSDLNNNVAFILTGQILFDEGANFNDIVVIPQSTLLLSNETNRDRARACGDLIGYFIMKDYDQMYTAATGFVANTAFYGYDGIAQLSFRKITSSPEHLLHRGTFLSSATFTTSAAEIEANSAIQIFNTLAPFGEYGVGIVYADENLRTGFVQECGSSFIERFDSNNTETEYGKAMQYRLRLSISHLAPTWARYWMPVVTENKKMETFFEVDVSIDTDPDLVSLIDSNVIKIRINGAIALWNDFYGNTLDSLPEYTFTKGDRIILYNTDTELYHDREILKQEDEYIFVSNNGTLFANAAFVDRLIKVYTPKKTNLATWYYEVGEINDVYSLGRHRNNKTEDIQAFPADTLEYLIDFGDVYLNTINNYKAANSIAPISQPTYNEFYRAFYPSKLNNRGRIHTAKKIIQTGVKKDRLRHSFATVDEANIKGWNKFDFDDKVDMGEQYGKIVGLATLGYTLKVVTELKLISIYVNRSVPVNPDGSESIILSDRTIGAVSVPEYNYGCKHPDSIIKNDRNLYYYNADNGMVIRDSANGQFPINTYKYESYFEKVSKTVRADRTNIKVFAGFNKDDSEYFLIFNNDASQQQLPVDNDLNVVIFNEDKNRWTSHAIYKNVSGQSPEWVEFSNDTFLTFLNGITYFENSLTANACNIYGVQRIPYIDSIVNPDPKKIKTYRGIAIHSTDKWSLPESGDILIYPTTTYPNGMSSRLKPNKLVDKEGIFYSEFLGDGLSKQSYLEGLINGRQLRGSVMRIRLRCLNVNNLSKLFSASVRFNYSEHSY